MAGDVGIPDGAVEATLAHELRVERGVAERCARLRRTGRGGTNRPQRNGSGRHTAACTPPPIAATWRRCEKLIAARTPLDARDAHGRTPLHVATFAKQRDVIRALAAAGANLGALENDRYDAVTIAAVADDEETLRVLLALGASAKLVTSRYDGTALIAAAHLGHDGVVRQLIAAGAPLDHVNNLHWTALIESIVLGDGGPRHVATLRALVEAGANTALADRNGQTPLALARSRGYEPMVRILVAAGAK